MTNLYLTQHQTASHLAGRVLELEPARSSFVHLDGAVGTGRTTILHLTKEEIQRRGYHPILLLNEQSEFDAGAAQLARLIDAVVAFDPNALDVEWFKNPATPWFDKFTEIKDVLNQKSDQIIFLCDEPQNWSKLDRGLQDDSEVESQQIADWLLREAIVPRVITGYIPNEIPRNNKVRTPKFDPIDFLRNNTEWEACQEMAFWLSQHWRGGIEYRSVMEVRLAVAFAWLFSPKIAAFEIRNTGGAAAVLKRLLDQLESSAKTDGRIEGICHALSGLTIGRMRWSENLLEKNFPRLSKLDRSVIQNAFCEEWPDGFTLHPLVRYEVIGRSRDPLNQSRRLWQLPEQDQQSIHKSLFQVVEARANGGLFCNLECLEHWALAGNTLSPGNRQIHFVEQLHQIGFTLSYRYRQHAKAVEVYRMALGFDPNNARSHHYLAFNLDWNAEQPDEVEYHYQEAVRANDEHPWYHSRWISYLVTRGQNKKARVAWQNAINALSVSEESPDWIFKSLHRWVARWMLHWGELGTAESILNSIRPELRNESSVKRLYDLLAALRLAEEGIAVFPLSVPQSRWWIAAGHTGLPVEVDGQRLVWYPARINAVEEGIVYLTVGKPDSESKLCLAVEEQEFSLAVLEKAAHSFSSQDLVQGRFIELGNYGDLGLKKVGLHQSVELNDPELLPLVPPPDRWFKKAVQQSHHDWKA